MISKIEFDHFRGFERLSADLSPDAYIVGPNSAGKSTVLEAVALAEQVLQRARRMRPKMSARHRGLSWQAFPIGTSRPDGDDPVRHDFGTSEARVSIEWTSGNQIHLVWPEDDDDGPLNGFAYLEQGEQGQPRSMAETMTNFPPVTVVPMITPLEKLEELRDPKYIRAQRSTRLASRHFRNHAFQMDQAGTWGAFVSHCQTWLPEIDLLDVTFNAAENLLGVFYAEPGSRVPKELAWAGDGFQIWVQLLWHLFQADNPHAVLLDEPDVFLHPDLQRRLVRLLNSLGTQVLLTSHSSDVVTEAPQGGVLWVDRKWRRAKRVSNSKTMSALSESLGSSYNFALVRSLRAQLVVASDCVSGAVFRQLARTVGALNLVNERTTTVVEMATNRTHDDHADLAAALRDVLPDGLPAMVWLGSAHRPPTSRAALEQVLSQEGLRSHLWSRPDLQSFLLQPAAIARASGAAPEAVEQHIADIMEELRSRVRSEVIAAWVTGMSDEAPGVAVERAILHFENVWINWNRRIELVGGTQVLRGLNRWLIDDGYRAVDSAKLARSLHLGDLDHEVVAAFIAADELLSY